MCTYDLKIYSIQRGIKMNDKSSVMLIDGMALLFRGFYATSHRGNFMINSKGTPTNAIFGFLNYFLDAVKTFQPSHIICCWDMGSKTFRTTLYDQYKANRGAPPVELIPQFDLIKEVVEAFDVPNIGIEGFEADDCIGTLAQQYSKDTNVQILTGDQDILQLVNERISVIIMKKGQGNYAVYRPDTLYKEKGITSLQMVDLKGLMGDASDNYPGVKGIGEKTALKLLQEYHSIEGILENLTGLSKGVAKKIEENLDMLHLSRKLARINCNTPVSCTLEECLWELKNETVKQKLEEMEIKGLTRLLG
jgi:5'-3' exonuclease